MQKTVRSPPDYVDQADAICQKADDQVEPLFDAFYASWQDLDVDPAVEVPPDSVFVAYHELMSEAVAVWGDSLDDLRALGMPDGDEPTLERLYDDFEETLAPAVRLSEAAADGGPAEKQAMVEGEDPFHQVNTRARVYGLDVCGAED